MVTRRYRLKQGNRSSRMKLLLEEYKSSIEARIYGLRAKKAQEHGVLSGVDQPSPLPDLLQHLWPELSVNHRMERFADAVGVTIHTVVGWYNGTFYPLLPQAFEIERLTRGMLPMEAWLGMRKAVLELFELRGKQELAYYDIEEELRAQAAKDAERKGERTRAQKAREERNAATEHWFRALSEGPQAASPGEREGTLHSGGLHRDG